MGGKRRKEGREEGDGEGRREERRKWWKERTRGKMRNHCARVSYSVLTPWQLAKQLLKAKRTAPGTGSGH